MRQYEPEPRPYELMVLISPEVTDEALAAEVDRISGIITDQGGTVTHIKRDTPWGRRRLAYPIKNFRDATYVLYHFRVAPRRVAEIDRELRLDERVIRYLLVEDKARERAEAEQPSPAATQQEAPAQSPTPDEVAETTAE